MFKSWIRSHKILATILLIGFILRISSILWGVPVLPYIRGYHPDEPKVSSVIMRFPEVYLQTDVFKGYGTTVQFIIGLLFLPAKLLLVKLFGLKEAYSFFVIVLSRFVSVMAGTATIYLLYRLSRKLFDEKVGLLSAAFFATAFYPTLNSSIITLDVIMGFLLVVNLIICIHAIENNKLFPYVALGAATGILIGTKITSALFIAIPFFLNFLKTVQSENSQENNSPAKNAAFLIVYLLIAGIVFFIFNPHIFISPVKYVLFFIHNKAIWIDAVRVPFSDMLMTWAKQTAICVGLPIALLSLGGILLMSS